MQNNFIYPNWPAPNNIRAYATTRLQGDLKDLTNQKKLMIDLHLPSEPCWLQQVHGAQIIQIPSHLNIPPADASYTTHPNIICAVFTADCLPILICNRAGTHVAAIHAGWRGLAAGIIEEMLRTLTLPASELLIWLGPAISPTVYEVGPEVLEQFPERENKNSRYLDLYQIARQRLVKMGIESANIYGGNFCTYTETDRFFSYRREKEHAGRMASLIYIL